MIAQHPYTENVKDFRPVEQLIPGHWQRGFVMLEDGARIHYRRTGGDRPVVLLLHGVQVDGRNWLRTAQALEATYDVIMPDFRGHGQTGDLEKGVSAEVLVNDMMGLIRGLQLDSPLVIGHSMGADIAGRLAAVYPLRALVLVDPALQNFAAGALMAGDEPPPWMQTIIQTMQSLKSRPHEARMVAGLGLLMPGAPLWAEADYVTYIEGQAEFDVRFFRHIAQMGYLFESPAVIAKIACPILLMTVRPMMSPAKFEEALAAFKNNWQSGTHVHFADSGHAIMFDQFERFVSELKQFFARYEHT